MVEKETPMKSNITLTGEIVEYFVFIAHNKDIALGQYYAEDAYDIIARTETLEDLIVVSSKEVMKAKRERGFCLSSWHLERHVVLKFNIPEFGEREATLSTEEYNDSDFLNRMLKSEINMKLEKEYNEYLIKKQESKAKAEARRKEREERLTLRKLKEKYE